MKLYSILILRKDADKAKILASQFDLSSFGFFQRGRYILKKKERFKKKKRTISKSFQFSVQEFMNFSAATIAERTPAGQRQSVESESK